MAKKKEENTKDAITEDLLPAIPDLEEDLDLEPLPEESEGNPDEAESLFTVGTYAGMEILRCAQCPWDTTKGEAYMLAHIQERHTPPLPPPPAEPLILLADKSGREVKG